jgi:hypothetical protein
MASPGDEMAGGNGVAHERCRLRDPDAVARLRRDQDPPREPADSGVTGSRYDRPLFKDSARAARNRIERSIYPLRRSTAMRTRTDLLNYLAARIQARRYLEIGVSDPYVNFDRIRVQLKHGVDPNRRGPLTFQMTSDDFFASLDPDASYDLVFVDGLHLAEQAERDIVNSLNHLSLRGVIVVHDCNPATEEEQSEEYDGVADWSGTTWKAWVKLRATRSDLTMRVVDIDHGCGIIQRGSQEPASVASVEYGELEYAFLEARRADVLNLVSAEAVRLLY